MYLEYPQYDTVSCNWVTYLQIMNHKFKACNNCRRLPCVFQDLKDCKLHVGSGQLARSRGFRAIGFSVAVGVVPTWCRKSDPSLEFCAWLDLAHKMPVWDVLQKHVESMFIYSMFIFKSRSKVRSWSLEKLGTPRKWAWPDMQWIPVKFLFVGCWLGAEISDWHRSWAAGLQW